MARAVYPVQQKSRHFATVCPSNEERNVARNPQRGQRAWDRRVFRRERGGSRTNEQTETETFRVPFFNTVPWRQISERKIKECDAKQDGKPRLRGLPEDFGHLFTDWNVSGGRYATWLSYRKFYMNFLPLKRPIEL